MGRRSNISRLPEEVRHWLERALAENNFSEFAVLENELRDRGYSISKSAIHRHSQQIQRRFEAIKASTEAARLLTEGAADDMDTRSGAIIALVQSELFEAIISLQEASDEDDKGERIGLLSDAAKNIATLTRASVTLKKFQLDLRDKIDQKLKTMEREAEAHSGKANAKAGFDLDTLRRVREEIYGIVGERK